MYRLKEFELFTATLIVITGLTTIVCMHAEVTLSLTSMLALLSRSCETTFTWPAPQAIIRGG